MATTKLIVSKTVSLKNRQDLSEKWVEDRLLENPSLFGLGEVEVKGRQRSQPKAGRLDLLLEDTESKKRYEVELQLGKSDESHIIRAIEYWDYERKRYPQYDHCAVLIAEDITSRFLNVINLFNGIIPFVAIQMQAYEVGDGVMLTFTKIVDEMELGEDDSTTIVKGTTTRANYEEQVPRQILEMVDNLFATLGKLDTDYELKYNKYYIGLARFGVANNFIQFRPKQNFLKLTFKHEQSGDIDKELETAGVDVMGYDSKWREYTIRVYPKDFGAQRAMLEGIIKKAYEWNSRE